MVSSMDVRLPLYICPDNPSPMGLGLSGQMYKWESYIQCTNVSIKGSVEAEECLCLLDSLSLDIRAAGDNGRNSVTTCS